MQVQKAVCLGNEGTISFDLTRSMSGAHRACCWLRQRLHAEQQRAQSDGVTWQPREHGHRKGLHASAAIFFKVHLWCLTLEQECWAETCRALRPWQLQRWRLPDRFSILRKAFDAPRELDAELDDLLADQFEHCRDA